METVHEEWRAVVGFEGEYEVSNLGSVRSLSRDVPCLSRWGTPRTFRLTGRILSTWLAAGYPSVVLRKSDKRQVHRLVMAAFVGEANGLHVNHLDGDKTNNALPNLEYVTPKENTAHAMATGLMPRDGEKNPAARNTAEQIRAAHAMVVNGASYSQASAATGATVPGIVAACLGKKWKSLGLSVIRRERSTGKLISIT